MTKKPSLERDDAVQSAAFIAKARELEADGDDSATNNLMGKLAKMKPEPRKKGAVKPGAKG